MFIQLNIMYKMVYSIITTIIMNGIYLFEKIISIIAYGMNENIAMTLVTVEAGLMILYFTFLPMILDNKNKEYYLGYKVSDWLIYKNFDTKWNDINVNWILNVILIVIEIVLLQYEVYSIVFLLFILFIILISKKVINYTRFITNPNIFDRNIQIYFMNNITTNKNEISENIEKNCLEDAKSFNKTMEYLLDNLDNTDVKEIFQNVYYTIINSNNQKNIYRIYELLSNKIEKLSKDDGPLNFTIMNYEWYGFIKSNVNEINEKNLFSIFINIYKNNLMKYETNSYDNINFLKSTQSAIDDSSLSNQTKEKWLSGIIDKVHINIRISGPLTNKEAIYSYMNSLEFIKYIFDSKDRKKLDKLFNIIDSMSDFKQDILPTMIGIYVYLIYLTEYEISDYISNEDRNYYRDILIKINSYINLKETRIYNLLNAEDIFGIFEILSHQYMNWERMKNLVVKSINSDTAYNMLYKIFVIYSKMQYFDIKTTVDEREVKIFRGCFEEDKFDSNTEKSILNISSKLNIPIDSNILVEYAKNLMAYVTNKYKNRDLISEDEYNSQLEKIKKLENSSNDVLSKIEIFKNNEFNKTSTITFDYNIIVRKDLLGTEIDYLLEEPDELARILESRIYNILASKMKNKVNYDFRGKEILEKLIEYREKKYIYLTSNDDNYGEEYMLGKKYLDVTNNYNVIHTSIRAMKMILNKLELKFNKLKIETVQLDEIDLENEIENYRISDNKYMFNNNNYGYSIEFNKEEMKQYIKKNFTKIIFHYSVDFGNYSDIDGCILLYDFNS